ncbi:AAA family ATPase [Caviibacter abscessus]|uniref:AAA family ATPase n=1 Tax=Caviibacter abscessus TaxID=1766719 RepID=UPI0008390845|nr:AAA family ATPase [Caviibacter abscessus]
MYNKNIFDWVDFYKAFANSLLAYKNKRNELIDIIKNIYEEIDINMPTLEKDNNIIDIDPFTVFGLFNKSFMKESNRVKIISSFVKKLQINVNIPTSFASIPVLNNQNATFYSFNDVSENDINELWLLFESALKYSENPSEENRSIVSKYFDIVINKKGNDNSKVTMGLYWISPNVFLNLDRKNEWYIYETKKIPEEVIMNLPKIKSKIKAKNYFDISEKIKTYLQSDSSQLKDFKELSFAAWNYSNKVNEKNKAKRDEKGEALADDDVDTIHYWIYSPGENSNMWEEFYDTGVMAIGWSEIGDLSLFNSKDEMKMELKKVYDPTKSYRNTALATWQFANEMKIGDIVYVKKGTYQLIGRGIVESDYVFDSERKDDYKNIRKVNWTHKGEWLHPGQVVMKTLTDITVYTEYIEKLRILFDNDEIEKVEDETPDIVYPVYDKAKFLEDVFMSNDQYNTLVGLIKSKKNVILQGAPGVGKTFAAKRLAYSIMGCKDQERVMMVQFHQSYSYEDFIEGFRPIGNGNFDIKKGSFYNFCKRAADDLDKDYFFIIDEINRGNLSKIFGELFMLIESDKRGNALQLLYSDEKFFVPRNVYIIGMMNTADRSLAMLDYALRRRFAFYEMRPGFDTDGFRKYRMTFEDNKFNSLINCVENLNYVISSDESLGEGFCIGHSYFCNLNEINDEILMNIVEYELIPMLKEYWFDELFKVKDWSENLRRSIK